MSKKCINDYYNKIYSEQMIEFDEIQALIDAWKYGSATPMISLVNALHRTYDLLVQDKTLQYTNRENELCDLHKDNFKAFVSSITDESVYDSVMEDVNEGVFR